MLGVINRSGEHLLRMVDEVLSLSRIEAGRIELTLETFDVVQLLQDIGQMFRSRAKGKGAAHLTLNWTRTATLWLLADAGKVRQVLINLLGNAVKYTEKGDV